MESMRLSYSLVLHFRRFSTWHCAAYGKRSHMAIEAINKQTQMLSEEQIQKVQTHVLGDNLPRIGGLVLDNEQMYGVRDTIYNAFIEL
jgi:hypothetical protein